MPELLFRNQGDLAVFLLDGEELSAGADPLDPDTDDDTLDDLEEVATYGTDPLDAQPVDREAPQ